MPSVDLFFYFSTLHRPSLLALNLALLQEIIKTLRQMIGLGTPPSAPIRLAILEADEPLPIIKAVRGRFGAIFTLLLRAACESLDLPQTLDSQLSLSTYDVVAGDPDTAYPDPETIDAVLITGSRHSAFENHHWIIRLVEYTRRLLEGNRVRVIGVCFGHQITARALGAQIARSPNYWELSVTELELTEEGKRVFGADTLVSRISSEQKDQRSR